MSRLIPFIAVIFSIGLFFLYINPTYSGSITTSREQIKSYDDALAAADHFQQREAQLAQQRSQIPSDSLARLNEFLPDGVDNVQLILDMDALAARSNVTLSAFDTPTVSDSSASTPSTPTSGSMAAQVLGSSSNSPVESLNLNFKATGSYAAFRSFLAGMESSLRPLDVTSVDVSDSATGIYSYGITARIYWLR